MLDRNELLENRELAKKYPFLQHRNWNGEKDPNDTFEYIGIKYDIPEGWWRRFGTALCEDLKPVLQNHHCLNDCRILDAKEKYGSLRLYLSGAPEEWSNHDWAWEYISEHTCIKCGDFPVPMRDTGWISPWCDQCLIKAESHYKKNALNPEDLEKYTIQDDKRLLEYLIIERHGRGAVEEILIDMKPYYDAIGWNYSSSDLIGLEKQRQIIKERKAEAND